jgi:alpha-ketoglutaric semialdehyde dehydrogenase
VVLDEIEDAFLRMLREEVEALPLGPVDDPAAAVGPLINAAARDRVQAAVNEAAGSRIFGGMPPRNGRFDRGFYIEPAVLRDVDPDSTLAQDEIFGPVLATLVASDLDEALELANRTRYGLSASLFTRDLGAALTYIDRVEAGLVRVNGDTTGVDPHAPFGGVKASSSGTREQGSAARDFYTEFRTVQVQP